MILYKNIKLFILPQFKLIIKSRMYLSKYFNFFKIYMSFMYISPLKITPINTLLSIKYYLSIELFNNLNFKTTKTFTNGSLNLIKNNYLFNLKLINTSFKKNKSNILFFLKLLIVLKNYINYTNTLFFKKQVNNINLNLLFNTYLNLFYFKIRNS